MILVGTDEGFEDVSVELDRRGRPVLPMRLGIGAAERLGMEIGDVLGVITFVTPRRSQTRSGSSTPKLLQMSCKLVEKVKTGRYDQDLDRAELPREALARFLDSETGFTEILVRTAEGVDPEVVVTEIESGLQLAGFTHPGFRSTMSWRMRGGNLLRAVENQRGMLSIVFFFIVLVAAYQLVATLTLTVTEKRRDISVLRALGATPGRIIRFYVSLGLLISVIGTALGLLLGQWLVHNLETVEKWVGGGQPIFRAEIYKFDHIPVAVDVNSVLILVGATLTVAVLFSVVPAWRASRVHVIKGLRSR
jgi:lipoprotein-releasing system permease protein